MVDQHRERSILRVVRQTGLYAVGNVAVKAAGLILAPLYLNTSYLPTESYGHLLLLEVTAQILIPVAGLGLATAMIKFMAAPRRGMDPSAIPFTTWSLSIPPALVVFGLVWVWAPSLAAFLVDDVARVHLPRMMGGYVALKVIGLIPYTLLRVRERAGWYALSIAAEWFVLVVGVYYFLAFEGSGLHGVMTAYLISAAAGVIVMSAFMLARVSWRLDRKIVGRLVWFGVPLVLSSVARLILNVGDRYVLKWLTDAEMVALYGWASRLGGIINMLLVQSFQLAFTVVGLKTFADGDASLDQRVLRHYTAWTGWAVLAVSLFAYDLTLFLSTAFGVGTFYLDADLIVFPIALGFMAYGLYIIVNNMLYAQERTGVIGLNVLGAAAINVLLNFILIPVFGLWGAALATLVAYGVLVALSAGFVGMRARMEYPWGVVIVVVAVIVVLWAIALPTRNWSLELRLGARLLLLAAYAPVLFVLGKH